ncbi:hypothetical protein C8F04DRAFT_45281 [Mycena alexandri]|uniref:Uncharacterized protein n=1 Tax=Mycena alexandri TaxID=1745969 RepID=A0AAD6WVU6_9AGAR|nr:hypothetical protein C8F04DRAFT_45281 [Mycena alexandri]
MVIPILVKVLGAVAIFLAGVNIPSDTVSVIPFSPGFELRVPFFQRARATRQSLAVWRDDIFLVARHIHRPVRRPKISRAHNITLHNRPSDIYRPHNLGPSFSIHELNSLNILFPLAPSLPKISPATTPIPPPSRTTDSASPVQNDVDGQRVPTWMWISYVVIAGMCCLPFFSSTWRQARPSESPIHPEPTAGLPPADPSGGRFLVSLPAVEAHKPSTHTSDGFDRVFHPGDVDVNLFMASTSTFGLGSPFDASNFTAGPSVREEPPQDLTALLLTASTSAEAFAVLQKPVAQEAPGWRERARQRRGLPAAYATSGGCALSPPPLRPTLRARRGLASL